MQISVKFCQRTSFLDVDPSQSVRSLKEAIGAILHINALSLVLVHNAQALKDSETVAASGMQNLSSLSATLRVAGGRGSMSDNDRAIAMRYRNIAKVCRKCYAKLPPDAESCRKPDCRSRNLRPKKLKKDVKK
jgi:ribosomal protein L40E